MVEVVDKLLDLSPTFGEKLVKRVKEKNMLLWRELMGYVYSRHTVKPTVEARLIQADSEAKTC